MTTETPESPAAGRVWDALYRRGLEGAQRPAAERDSVPIPQDWGLLPPSEVEANSFLIDVARQKRRWLDLGCGTASVTAALLRQVPLATAVGIDASRVAVEQGRSMVMVDADVASRLELRVGDIAAPPITGSESFDLVYALFSMQFLRPGQVERLIDEQLAPVLPAGGVFAGTVRSVHRSRPDSYEQPWPEEPNTFLSHEPHEEGLVYHHYSEQEIRGFADRLGSRIALLKEKRSYRAYDPAPVRAWWDFVMVRQ